MWVPVASSEDMAFDVSRNCTKGQKFVQLSLNLSSAKALVVIF